MIRWSDCRLSLRGPLTKTAEQDVGGDGVKTVELDIDPPLNRYTPLADRSIQQANNFISYDNWAVNWGRDVATRSTRAQVGNDFGFFGAGLGVEQRNSQVFTGWRDALFELTTDRTNQAAGVGFIKGNYGVKLDRSNLENTWASEVVARATEFSTLVDFLDRDYGQRVKIRDFEAVFRHDFDEFVRQDGGELATEVFIAFKTLGVAISSDVADTEFGVSIGYRGYQISALRDFNARQTDIQANFGNGWQLSLLGDFPDIDSTELFGKAAFGKLGRAYVSASAGIGDDGIPQAGAEVQTTDMGFGVDFVDNNGNRFFLYSITIGKFSYIWESRVVPDNFRIPVILGVDPISISQFLIPENLPRPFDSTLASVAAWASEFLLLRRRRRRRRASGPTRGD
eukprot:Selendium_serpulae@DN3962_c0_g1_i2.p1